MNNQQGCAELYLEWDFVNADLVTDLGPVPLVPWGTTWNRSNNTTRRLLTVPGMVLGVGVTSPCGHQAQKLKREHRMLHEI